MHKFLLKNAYPIVRILDSILTSSSSCSSKSNHMLINEIRELVSDALAALSQSNQELLQQRQDGITKYLSKEYKTLKPNVLPDPKLLFGDDLNSRIKLLQASNKTCKTNITSNNGRYYETFSSNFSRNQENSKNVKDFLRRIISTKTLFEKNRNRDKDTNRSSSTEIREPGKGYTLEIKCNTDTYN